MRMPWRGRSVRGWTSPNRSKPWRRWRASFSWPLGQPAHPSCVGWLQKRPGAAPPPLPQHIPDGLNLFPVDALIPMSAASPIQEQLEPDECCLRRISKYESEMHYNDTAESTMYSGMTIEYSLIHTLPNTDALM